jgi:hypothetical protein
MKTPMAKSIPVRVISVRRDEQRQLVVGPLEAWLNAFGDIATDPAGVVVPRSIHATQPARASAGTRARNRVSRR